MWLNQLLHDFSGLWSTRRQRRGRRPETTRRPQNRRALRLTVEQLEERLNLNQSTYNPAWFSPAQIQQAYGFNVLLNEGYNGYGQTIAVINIGDDPDFVSSTNANFDTSDLHIFDQQFGLPDPPSFLKVSQTGSQTSLPAAGTAQGEESLDVELAHEIAPEANIILVECNSGGSGTNLFTGADWAATPVAGGGGGASVVSISYKVTGANESSDDATYFSPSMYPGVTFLSGAGDKGSVDQPQYPADSPYFVSGGGTSLTTDEGAGATATASLTGTSVASCTVMNGGSGYQAAYPPVVSFSGGGGSGAAAAAVLTNGVVTSINVTSPGTGYTSAPTVTLTNTDLGNYVSETVWNISSTGGGETGGGLSTVESQPDYQQGLVIHNGNAIVSSNGMRAFPDIAFDANPDTGYAIYDSYKGQGVNWFHVGGDSSTGPAWSGLMAIVDQMRMHASLLPLTGNTQTLPILYSLYNDPAAYSQDFHDITSGNNNTYSAGPGYDLVTGIGSPIANNLIPAMASALAYTAPSGSNNFLLEDSTGTIELLDNGSVVASGPLTAVTSVVVDGGTDNTLTINYAGLPSNLTVSFTGGTGAGIHTLTLTNASFTNKTYDYTGPGSGIINLDGETIIISSMSSIADSTSQANLNLDLPSAAKASLQDNGNSSDDISEIASLSGGFVTTTFESPAASLAITTAGGNSVVQLAAMDNGFSPTTEAFTGATGDLFQFETATAISSSTSVALTAATLDLNGFSPAIDALSGNGIITDGVSTPSTLTVGSNNGSGIFSGVVQNGAGNIALTKTGTGTLTLSGADTYNGATTVSAGALLVDGSLASTPTVAASATLAGSGGSVAAPVVVNGILTAGDTVSPTGLLTVGNLSFGSGGALNIALNGTTPGSGFDQVAATGTIDLTGAALNLTVGSGFSPIVGTSFDILVNGGGSTIVDTFSGLAEGGVRQVGGVAFKITYLGGASHNDVVLTVIPETTTSASSQTATFSSADQNVMLSATVTASGGGNPINEGTVTFAIFNGATQIGNAATSNTVSAGAASAAYVLPGGTAQGTYTIVATYNPGPDYAGSSDNSQTLTVSLPIAVTSVTVNGDTAPILSAAELTSGSAAVTVTTDGPSGFLAGQVVSIAGVNVGGDATNDNGYNGVWTITGVGTDSFTFTSNESGLAAANNGTGTATTDQIPSIAITTDTESSSGAGTTTTATTASANGYVGGERVIIAGVSAGGTTNNVYNGTYTVGTVLSPTSFTYTASASGLAAGSGGTASTTAANAGLLAGTQRSMVDSIVYKFNEAVTLGSGAISLGVHSGVTGTANAVSAPNVIYATPDGGYTWIATFVTGNGATVSANSIADGVYDITLNNSAVAAVAGSGSLASSRTDTFWRLFGDFSGNASVNTTDRVRFNAAYASMAGAANFFAAFDDGVNGGTISGNITNTDRILFNAQSGKAFTGFTATI